MTVDRQWGIVGSTVKPVYPTSLPNSKQEKIIITSRIFPTLSLSLSYAHTPSARDINTEFSVLSPLMASARTRHLMEEANENEQEYRDVALSRPPPPPLSLPRSPLISITNPSQTPKSAQTTPKSAASKVSSRRFSELPPLSEPRGTTRERGFSKRILESCGNLGSVEQLMETPCFELNEDLSFCRERNVQVKPSLIELIWS